MAKYYTKRKFKNKNNQVVDLVKNEIDYTVDYIRQWQKKELGLLAYKSASETPICIPINKNFYIVGYYGIKKQTGIWYSIDSRTEKEFCFSSKKTAILHAVSVQKGKLQLADDLLKYDNQISKFQTDIEVYQHRMNNALKYKDYWRYDFFNSLYSTAYYKRENSKKRLQKSIDLAKYFKIWMS